MHRQRCVWVGSVPFKCTTAYLLLPIYYCPCTTAHVLLPMYYCLCTTAYCLLPSRASS